MNTTEKILFSLVAIWFSLCAPLIVTLGVRSTSFDIVSTLLALSGIYLVNRWVRVTFKTDPRAAEYFNDPLIAKLRKVPLIKVGFLLVGGAIVWALIGLFVAASSPHLVAFVIVGFLLLLIAASLAWFARLLLWVIDKSKD